MYRPTVIKIMRRDLMGYTPLALHFNPEVCSFESSVNFYQATGRHIPEDNMGNLSDSTDNT
jgi:hypothetical protein